MNGEPLRISCDWIRPMPDQPRRRFDKLEMDRLQASIHQDGQAVPIIVRVLHPSVGQIRYELVDGERRWRVCKKLGIAIKATVEELDDTKKQYLRSVVSNFHGCDHDELETYDAVMRIKRENDYTIDQTAKVFGKSTAWVQFWTSLTKLLPEVRNLMSHDLKENERILFGHAVQIARLPQDEQMEFAKEVITKKLSIPQIKHRIDVKEYGTCAKKISPDDERAKIRNFVMRYRKDLELLLLRKPSYFDAVLDSFSRELFVQDIDQFIRDLQDLKTALKQRSSHQQTA